MSLCVVNAYSLFVRSHSSYTHLAFRLELSKSLATAHAVAKQASEVERVRSCGVALAHEHYSINAKEDRDCVVYSDPAQREACADTLSLCGLHA